MANGQMTYWANLAIGVLCLVVVFVLGRANLVKARLILVARTIIVVAIVALCVAIGYFAYRWLVFSEAPGASTLSGLIFLTAAVVFALIRVRTPFKE
jgi:hypothetical protein